MTSPRRGDIVLVAGDVFASKPRPAVVIQDHLFHATSSVTVCPVTTTESEASLLRLSVPAGERTGLAADSQIMVDKITTVRRRNVTGPIGELTPEQLLDLERRILVFLGLAA